MRDEIQKSLVGLGWSSSGPRGSGTYLERIDVGTRADSLCSHRFDLLGLLSSDLLHSICDVCHGCRMSFWTR